jgi:hypothetical protein
MEALTCEVAATTRSTRIAMIIMAVNSSKIVIPPVLSRTRGDEKLRQRLIMRGRCFGVTRSYRNDGDSECSKN